MITEVVVAYIGCEDLHITEALFISPVIAADGSWVEGLLGSSADFCDVCEKPAYVLSRVFALRELDDEAARWHGVRRHVQ